MIGAGNRFAHASALAVAELPGEAYNPLFLYGEPGLGKTHLLVSIANYLRRRRPDMTVVYTTAERFTSEFITSVRGSGPGTERFKQRYRNVGALLIDDIQFLENKPKTEDEFFHTFNELYSNGSQIVLSSDRPPEAMERLTERLRDRFAWGLTVQVQPPDMPTRVALLRRLAAERALGAVDIEVLRQIAVHVPANLRKLEGALTRVAAFSSLIGEAPSPELVSEALSDRAAGELGPIGSDTRTADRSRRDPARHLRRPAHLARRPLLATPHPERGPRPPTRDVRRPQLDRRLARRDRPRLQPRSLDRAALDPHDRETDRARLRYPQSARGNPRTPADPPRGDLMAAAPPRPAQLLHPRYPSAETAQQARSDAFARVPHIPTSTQIIRKRN